MPCAPPVQCAPVQPGVVQELCGSEPPLWQVMEEGPQDVLGILIQALPLLAAVEGLERDGTCMQGNFIR